MEETQRDAGALPPAQSMSTGDGRGGFAAFMRTPGVKFIVIGILTTTHGIQDERIHGIVRIRSLMMVPRK